MKHSIKVDLAKGKNDLRPIRLRVSFGGCRVDLSLSESYNLSKWNADLERAKNNTRNDNRQTAAEINKAINFAVELIDKYFADCELRNAAPNAETLRAAFCRRTLTDTQKTSEPLRIELNQYTKAILEKHKDFDERLALYVVSNQKYNQHLKECCRAAGIVKPVRLVSFSGSNRVETVHEKWEVVSSHCARRTFVVECLRRGIPAEVIMKWTGHSDYKAMQPYVAIVDTLKKESMEKFND